jgi:prolyl 4-hydroxylase
MRGNFYANIFVHFEPIGALAFPPDAEIDDVIIDEEGREAMAQGLPPYVIPGSEWEAVWREQNARGWQLVHSNVHKAAQNGQWSVLQNIAIQNPSALQEPDENGWHPIHEAVRAGDPAVVKFLLDVGSNVNELAMHDDDGKEGTSPLTLAKELHDLDHPMIELLKSYGALEYGPEL